MELSEEGLVEEWDQVISKLREYNSFDIINNINENKFPNIKQSFGEQGSQGLTLKEFVKVMYENLSFDKNSSLE